MSSSSGLQTLNVPRIICLQGVKKAVVDAPRPALPKLYVVRYNPIAPPEIRKRHLAVSKFSLELLQFHHEQLSCGNHTALV